MPFKIYKTYYDIHAVTINLLDDPSHCWYLCNVQSSTPETILVHAKNSIHGQDEVVRSGTIVSAIGITVTRYSLTHGCVVGI